MLITCTIHLHCQTLGKNVWTTVLFLSAILHRNSLMWIRLHSGAGKKGKKLDETAENSFVQDISMTS